PAPATTPTAPPRRERRTRIGPPRARARARAGTGRAGPRAPPARSRPGRLPAATPPVARRESRAPRRREPSARGAGRTRATRPRRRSAAGLGARRWPLRLRCRRGRRPRSSRFEDGSYLYYYGKNHRASTRAVVDQLPEPVVQVLLQELDLAHVVLEQLREHALR